MALTQPYYFGGCAGSGSYGGMFLYDSVTAITITAGQQYHAVNLFGVSALVNGLTYGSGSSGAITDTADNGGVLRCTDATHGLTTGDYVCLHNMADAAHVGITQVTVIDPNTFDCDDITYNSDSDTGNWTMGDYLEVDAGSEGLYIISWAASMSSPDGSNKTFKVEMVKNATALDEFALQRKFGIQSDVGSMGTGGIVELAAGDKIWMQCKNVDADTSNVSFLHANVHMYRIC